MDPLADHDGDGLTDVGELTIYFSAPEKEDTDDDGLPDQLESTLRTALWNADTDGDGLSDAVEVEEAGFRPPVRAVDAAVAGHGGGPSGSWAPAAKGG